MPIRPPVDDGWNEFIQSHNASQVANNEPQGDTRAERRAARKRANCHFCKEPLLGSGKPMLPSKRWRCDVEASCNQRRAQRKASGL